MIKNCIITTEILVENQKFLKNYVDFLSQINKILKCDEENQIENEIEQEFKVYQKNEEDKLLDLKQNGKINLN